MPVWTSWVAGLARMGDHGMPDGAARPFPALGFGAAPSGERTSAALP